MKKVRQYAEDLFLEKPEKAVPDEVSKAFSYDIRQLFDLYQKSYAAQKALVAKEEEFERFVKLGYLSEDKIIELLGAERKK